jgi:phosphoribosylanthranilate isomerase
MIRIKICGVTSPVDAEKLADLGVDAVGLNFYPPSPRFLDLATAAVISRSLGPFVAAVGVFVEQSSHQIREIAHTLGLRAVQTYSPEVRGIDFAPTAHIWAFRVKDAESMNEIRTELRRQLDRGLAPAALLIDSHVAGAVGGTGQRAPWELLANFPRSPRLILAGGLTPDNVAEAILQVRPWGVDVASGVESAPGRKDLGKVRAFVQAVRAVSADILAPAAERPPNPGEDFLE